MRRRPRRRQLPCRRGNDRTAARARDPAGQPVFRLSRGRRVRATARCRISPLWTLYERLRAAGAPLSMRKVSNRSEIFPVFHELFQRRRGPRKPLHDRDRAFASVPGRRLGFLRAPARARRVRGDRARRARPRRLSQPDRGHHRRADARRLCLDRHAAVLQALVVRQAFRASGDVLSQGLPGPRLRDRDQLAVHFLPRWRKTPRPCRRW